MKAEYIERKKHIENERIGSLSHNIQRNVDLVMIGQRHNFSFFYRF